MRLIRVFGGGFESWRQVRASERGPGGEGCEEFVWLTDSPISVPKNGLEWVKLRSGWA
jgi:hypothetical protein